MNAITIANYIIYITIDTFNDVTNKKLNKLLYFAQGYYLSKYNKPMFDDKIEAWDHGPVVPNVFRVYKINGDRPISTYNIDDTTKISNEAEEILYNVARKYGNYSVDELENITHAVGSPWHQVYKRNCNIEIPLRMLLDYFSEHDAELKPPNKNYQDSDFIGYRDKEGILVLPKDWDDGEI